MKPQTPSSLLSVAVTVRIGGNYPPGSDDGLGRMSDASVGDFEEAFEQYEEWLRPLVEDAQDLPPGVTRIAVPKTRAGVQIMK